MALYHLTCSQHFYGQKDAKTYYGVPSSKVWAGLAYMADHFNADTVFVYRKQKGIAIGKNEYVGSYSRKYKNFRTPGGGLHTNYKF